MRSWTPHANAGDRETLRGAIQTATLLVGMGAEFWLAPKALRQFFGLN